MKGLTMKLAVTFLTIAVGALLSFASPPRFAPSPAPLRLTLSKVRVAASPQLPVDHYLVTVENVSSKTVQGYSLGSTCNCRGEGTHRRYPDGINFSNPSPSRQVLKPGESRTEVISAQGIAIPKLKVWVDLVHFTDGTNWGPNQSGTEGYVRALD
ncbi:MAG: hypothetical protein QOE77_437 [Blastocatellia bacterium]|jgi:hypothetical protein|nr:hypothetical protein [Blastocatellia bacterium]